MTQQERAQIHGHMLAMMSDSAHDCEHVHRVMRMCEKIARQYPQADGDILYASACLHDIGRSAQAKDPSVDHALYGAALAYEFLRAIGWDEARAEHVRACIRTHRYRGSEEPESIEAKILFDSDKLDVLGAMGVARTLMYAGAEGEMLYRPEELEDEEFRCRESFLTEYRRKLKNASARLYTQYAKEIAVGRDETMNAFVAALLREARAEDA